MAASKNDKLMKVGLATATNLDANYTAGATSLTVVSTSGMPTDTGITVAIDTIDSAGVQVPGSYNEYVCTVASATGLANVEWADGSGDTNYNAGATTRVYIPVAKTRENRIVEWGVAEHNQDGTHSDITATSITATTGTFNSITIAGSASAEGWSPLGATPNTVTANGNKSYDLVFNGTDLTDTISEGMRIRTARTVAAPIQCATFDGTNDYFSKSSPAGMTFTDDFVVSAWVKLSSYPSASGVIASRYNGTSGWQLQVASTGQVYLQGFNAGAVNQANVSSYQSLPLNKWVHVTAQLDMSTAGTSATTSYIMIDGVDVPSLKATGGTNPTALIQAGNLEIGTGNATNFFPGKIAQVAIYSAKVTQATIEASMNQGLTGSETSLVSAYSLSNSLEDLSANNNDLTANGGVLATTADSPFGNSGISTTLDYGIVMAKSFSTNTTLTVQVPEGCTIPTSGGVASMDYSINAVPYGFPKSRNKWAVGLYICGALPTTVITASTSSTAYPSIIGYLTTPIGDWKLSWLGWIESTTSAGTTNYGVFGGLYNMTTSKLVGTTLRNQIGASTSYSGLLGTTSANIELSSQTRFSFAVGSNWTTSGSWYAGTAGSVTGPTSGYTIEAENAYL